MGGFTASLITILLVGGILQLRTGGRSDYTIGDFKIALSVQFIIIAIGIVGILRTRTLARRRLADEGIVVRPIREVIAERRWFSPTPSGKAQSLDREPALTTPPGRP